MSTAEPTTEIIKSFPENFYDLIAYLFPSSILLIAPIFINESYNKFLKELYTNNTGTFEKLIFLMIVIIVLYVIGQMLTSVSWFTIYLLLGSIAKVCNVDEWTYKKDKSSTDLWLPTTKGFDRDWTSDFINIRAIKPSIGLEVTKRYSRHILARNNALVGIILTILAIFNFRYIVFIAIFTFLILSLYDTYIRRVWFLSYVMKAAQTLEQFKKDSSAVATGT